MNSTSLEVYHNEVVGKSENNRRIVLEAFGKARRPICNQELAEHLGWQINSVTPRVNELVKLKKLVLAFKAKYPKTGRTVSYWKLREN